MYRSPKRAASWVTSIKRISEDHPITEADRGEFVSDEEMYAFFDGKTV